MKIIDKNILINTLKISLAAVFAILVADILNLEFSISAGIVAILTIQPTKKETVATALGRLYAFIAAIIISYVSYQICGFTTLGFFVYLAVFIFVCQIFKWYSAMAMNSVLISHFLTLGAMNVTTVSNELAIFIIGVGIGIVANLHLRKRVDYIAELKNTADEQVIRILERMAERIIDKDITDYNGECFEKLNEHIRLAKNVAKENYNNQFASDDLYDMEYVTMRERQSLVLYEMYKCVRSLDTTPSTAKAISDFLKKMGGGFHELNDCQDLMADFIKLDQSMKSKPLPVERKEFEDRARLFTLLRSIEEFIRIKIDFFKEYN